jgi:hypothetical protein
MKPMRTACLALAVLLGGCGQSLSGQRLVPGQAPTTPAVGLAHGADAASGVLTYAVAFAGQATLLSVELALDFELVVHEIVHHEDGGPAVRELRRIALGSAAYDIEDMAVAPSGAGARVYVASRDGRVRGIDLATAETLTTWYLGSSVTAVAVSPRGGYVVMGTADGVLCLRRHSDGALLQCAVAHQGQISSLAVSPNGDLVASSSWTGEVTLWRLPTLAVAARRRFDGAACDVAFAPGGRKLAIARSAEPPIRSPAVVEREKKRGFDLPHPWHAVSVWDWVSDTAVHLRGHGGPVTTVAWTGDGARLVSGSWDRSVRMWDVAGEAQIARYGGFSLLVRDIAVDPRGRFVAVGAWTDRLRGRSTVVLDILY